MSIELLSAPIRKYIRDKRWEELRPIQHAAIQKITSTKEHYILASKTASGKTEAAFLPILSTVNFNDPGVQVLYISPLIALINDQFLRVEELCKNLEVPVTKWHGEAQKSAKNALVNNPSGVVLITPESIEAMFVNKPYQVKQLFSCLKFIVIDEIHSFIGSDRGIQLKSLLWRLQELCRERIRIVGLSATVGDYNQAKQFTGEPELTKVLLDRTSKEIEVVFRYFEGSDAELPLNLLKDLYLETKDNKVLVFPNSRGRAEEIAVKLKKISERVNGHTNYFSHHSSVDRDVREYVEDFAKHNRRKNFVICCTSTLELGIDIGSVDEVVQVDATSSIAALIQRIGRSGRREDEKSKLFLYATRPWSLLQALACWLLFKEGFIDPPKVIEKPYHILLHQMLSVVKGHSGLPYSELVTKLSSNHAFSNIEEVEIHDIIDHLLVTEILEKVGKEIIIGVEGEYIVNNRDFYSVFEKQVDFKVINKGQTIGELPISPQIIVGENILLAAKVWKILDVDEKSKKIEVTKASDGKKPMFFGGRGDIHEALRIKMMHILFSSDMFEFLDEKSNEELGELRKEFSRFGKPDIASIRLLHVGEMSVIFYSFTGSAINRTLDFLFGLKGIENIILNEESSSFELKVSASEFKSIWKDLANPVNLEEDVKTCFETRKERQKFSNWAAFLPPMYERKLFEKMLFDFDNTFAFIRSIQILECAK